jgi:hypothetical protein
MRRCTRTKYEPALRVAAPCCAEQLQVAISVRAEQEARSGKSVAQPFIQADTPRRAATARSVQACGAGLCRLIKTLDNILEKQYAT